MQPDAEQDRPVTHTDSDMNCDACHLSGPVRIYHLTDDVADPFDFALCIQCLSSALDGLTGINVSRAVRAWLMAKDNSAQLRRQ